MYPETNPAPPPALGGFDIAEEGKFIRVIGTGLWTVAVIDAHFVRLSAILRAIRAKRGYAAVLVDLKNAPAQPASVTAQLSSWTSMLYSAQDRVAIVVASSLLKAQMRRTEVAAARELFMSINAAEVWLSAPFVRVASRSRLVQ